MVESKTIGITQIVLGGLSPPLANFLQCTCTKNYESWLAVDKVIATIKQLTFLSHRRMYVRARHVFVN